MMCVCDRIIADNISEFVTTEKKEQIPVSEIYLTCLWLPQNCLLVTLHDGSIYLLHYTKKKKNPKPNPTP